MDAFGSRSGCARIARVRFARAARARSRAGEGRATDCARPDDRALGHAGADRGRRRSRPDSIEVVSRRSSPPCGRLSTIPAHRDLCWRFGFPSEAGARRSRPAWPSAGPCRCGLLRVPFRGLTLVAIRDLFGEEVTALEGARERAAWLFRRAAPRRPVRARVPAAHTALWPGGERRSPADYRRSGARNSRASRLGRRRPAARAASTARSGTADRRGPRAGFRDAIGRRGSRPGGRPTIKRERRPVVQRENRRLGRSFGAFPALKRERQHRFCAAFRIMSDKAILSDIAHTTTSGADYLAKQVTKRRRRFTMAK